jgi:plasmid stabilization system protein ParE
MAFCICYKKHILFFIVLSSGGIGIISILHERMDLLQRLQEDLVKMSI